MVFTYTCLTEMVKLMPHGLSGNVCFGSKMYSLYHNDADEIRYYQGKLNHLYAPCDENTQSTAN